MCVNGLNRVCICINVIALESEKRVNEQCRVREMEDGGKEAEKERLMATLLRYLIIVIIVSEQESVLYHHKILLQELFNLCNLGSYNSDLTTEGILSVVNHSFQCGS